MDYLFPSSQAAVANGQAQGVSARSSDIILNSPIVIYTYKDAADALVGSGIMSKDGDTYKFDTVKAVDAMVADRTWADLGYANDYGQFRIDSTDPAQSNSDNEWAVLVATALNGGQPATADSVACDSDKSRAIFQKIGWMETSSEDSFSQFLTLGEGSKPMMVGYESQVLDPAVNQPDLYKQVKDSLVVAYTTPTEWSTHVLVSLDDNGDRLRDFHRSDDAQKLAWERHGFRGASQLGMDSASRFGVPGMAERVPAAELPNNDVMQELIGAVAASSQGGGCLGAAVIRWVSGSKPHRAWRLTWQTRPTLRPPHSRRRRRPSPRRSSRWQTSRPRPRPRCPSRWRRRSSTAPTTSPR